MPVISNNIITSQRNEDNQSEETETTIANLQKLTLPTMTSSPSNNQLSIIYGQRHNQEEPQGSGRHSVISDPGYISCGGSDRSSVTSLSPGGEDEQSDCLSPCDINIADLLNDTYVESSFYRHLSGEDFENIESSFRQGVGSMSYYSATQSCASQIENSLCQRANTLQPDSSISPRHNNMTTMTSQNSWPKNISKNANTVQSRSRSSDEVFFQQNNFDEMFDGPKYGMYGDKASGNISSNSDYNSSAANNMPSMQDQRLAVPGHNLYSAPDITITKALSVEDFSLSVEDFCFQEDIAVSSENCVPSMNYSGQYSPVSDPYSSNCLQPNCEFDTSPRYVNKRLQSDYCTKNYTTSSNNTSQMQLMTSQSERSPRDAMQASEEKTLSLMTTNTEPKPRFSAGTSAEEDAWRTYLENPLTAATTAMMSIHGDEDSATALGLLYDYYKVPREKRLLGYPSTATETTQKKTAGSKMSGHTSDDVLLAPVSTVVGSTTLSSLIQQKDVTCTGPRYQKNDLSNDVITLRSVKTEPKTSHQGYASVADILKIVRPQLDKSKNQKSNHPLESPQDLSNPTFSELSSKYVTTPVTSGQSNQRTHEFQSNNSSNNNNNNNNFINNVLSTFSSVPQYLPIQSAAALNVLSSPGSHLRNLSYSRDMFEYIMEAPKSLKQKDGEPTMSYINKGQFYCITLRETSEPWIYKSTKVKSIIHIVFGDGKPEEEQLRHWRYWHARQHTVKQRILDIADYKESSMIYDIEEIGHNAISFSWNVNEVAKIFVNCNCLSTDFSAQKGIKGLPLLLQIDTYIEGQETTPVHRGQCQIKVFCDKGAERKIRDEERKATRRKQKVAQTNIAVTTANLIALTTADIKHAVTSSHTSHTGGPAPKKSDLVVFKTISDLESRPFLFTPEVPGHSLVPHGLRTPNMSPCDTTVLSPHSSTTQHSETDHSQSYFPNPVEALERGVKRSHSLMSSEESDMGSICKFTRTCENDVIKRVLLYVRRSDDDVYDGLMLKTPDLQGLKLAIEEKYKLEAGKITKIFKKSKKGILVNMDDNIIRHYSNEDTFIIDIVSQVHDDVINYKITFTEVW